MIDDDDKNERLPNEFTWLRNVLRNRHKDDDEKVPGSNNKIIIIMTMSVTLFFIMCKCTL